ncbi:hypothetical protein GALL_507400 [mine drainage metagenome]|uniref:Uncharacterized protein n=1 Tax=mine drainage metagenome TaxID=410659 RepID=A0A1J5P8U8_9ZZZZ
MCAKPCDAEPPKNAATPVAAGQLEFEQLMLARDRQLRQRSTAGDCGRINIFENIGEGGTGQFGMGNL